MARSRTLVVALQWPGGKGRPFPPKQSVGKPGIVLRKQNVGLPAAPA